MKNSILTINSGETSIKFSLYESGTPLTQVFYGAIESNGTKEKKLYFTESGSLQKKTVDINASDQDDVINFLMNWLALQEGFDSVKATGHRVAHGDHQKNSALVTPALLYELKKSCTVDSVHLHAEIALIEIFMARYPAIIQIACFETPLHGYRSQADSISECHPTLSFLQCYGFHGFSFEYLLEELYRVAGNKAAQGRIILIHLGNRKSLAAFKNGKSIDESVDFTAPGDLTDERQNSPLTFIRSKHINNASWWFATQSLADAVIAGTAAKTPGSIQVQNAKEHHAEDMEGFCYETRKWIGSFAAALGGIDTLVFTGGMGEHAPDVRSEICDSLAFLGIELDEVKNMNNENLVSADTSSVTVRIVQTNEEIMIARQVAGILHF